MQRNPVAAPPAQPPLYGLIAAAPIVDDADMRWVAGVSFSPEACGSSGRDSIAFCGPGSALEIPDAPGIVDADPFLVWAGDKCGMRGYGSRDFAGRARRQLEATQSYQVANELWTGTVRTADSLVNRALVDSESDLLTAGAMPAPVALGMVEQALAVCGQGRRGMVHVTGQVLMELVGAQVVIRSGQVWTTPLGTIVVADAGYDGSAPGGTPAGATQFMYGTSMLRVRLGPVEVIPSDLREAVDTATNTTRVYALRPALIEWDECCHVAAEVDTAVPVIGGAD